MAPVLPQQCLAKCCRNLKGKRWPLSLSILVGVRTSKRGDDATLQLCCLLIFGFIYLFFSLSVASLKAVLERVGCTCPVCQQQCSGVDTPEKRLSHNWAHWSCVLSKSNNKPAAFLALQAWRLVCVASKLSPDWALYIHGLLDFLVSPCFHGSRISRMLLDCLFYT